MVEVIPAGTKPSVLRRLAEVATRNLVLRSHLPARFGGRPIYISPANALRFLAPGDAKFDPFLLWMVDRFVEPQSVVWDIGANGGVFSMLAATKARTVIAFEPDPFNGAIIRRTVAANPDLDIRLAQVALADHVGSANLNIPKRGRSVSSIDGVPMGSQSGGLRTSITVPLTTVDDCLGDAPAPAFIKCDVEGAEAMMLRGARSLLNDVRPVICMEIRHYTCDEVGRELRTAGYRILTADDDAKEVTDLRNICDILAVPG